MSSDVPQESTTEERRRDPARVVSFTDGVFAVIITILVFNLKVPLLASGQSLQSVLAAMGPTFVVFTISFFMTGLYWVWHRDLFARVRYVNRHVVWLNLVFLLPASLVPFAASLLGAYHQQPAALHAYGVLFITLTAFRWLLKGYLMRRPELLWEPASTRSRRLGSGLSAGLIGVYGVGVLVANHFPRLSLAIFAGVPLLYVFTVTLLRKHPSTSTAADGFS